MRLAFDVLKFLAILVLAPSLFLLACCWAVFIAAGIFPERK